MAGIEKIPIRPPKQWDPAWFLGFVRDVLRLMDARNVIATPGIIVTGGPNEVATISYTQNDSGQQLSNRAFSIPLTPPASIDSQFMAIRALLPPTQSHIVLNDAQAIIAQRVFT